MPELDAGLQLYIDAFYDLSTERPSGMGFSRVPWSKIVKYADVYGFTGQQREALIHHIRSIDNYLIEQSKKTGG